MCRGLEAVQPMSLIATQHLYLSRFKKQTEILIRFLGICECIFETSFLLTLDIENDCFKGYQKVHKLRKL